MTAIRIPDRVARIAPPQFDILNARAAALRAAGHDVISLGQALPSYGPPPSAITAVAGALDRDDAHVYSPDAGRVGLRRALCDRLRAAAGIRIEEDEVIVTAGGNQAFMLALMTVVDPGDEVLLPAPYFANHEMAVSAFGAIPVEVPLDEATGFQLGWDDVEPFITRGTRAVVICTPSNPTGAVVGPDELRRLAAELASRGIALLADETYSRFVYDGEFASLASVDGWRENGIVVNTFSKTFGVTGWRVGYLMAARPLCEAALRIQDAMIICAPVLSQIGIEAALREQWDYPEPLRSQLRARRDMLRGELNGIPALGWTPTAGGFFAFVRVAGCTNAEALAAAVLERAHVVTIPGTTFGRCGEGFLRLSYAAVSDAALRNAIDRLRAFFADRSAL